MKELKFNNWRTQQFQPNYQVESGEGIESMPVHSDERQDDAEWNPVKELKADGLRLSLYAHPDKWNPVKELKVSSLSTNTETTQNACGIR